ncbi:MAG: hypothetical protein KAV82_10105 [Phycisphaerae bacterium]|nr:hypothetical protein [Phycisphaerae bacterium]
MASEQQARSVSLSELPRDELLAYGHSLGLTLAQGTPQGELLRRIRERQELLVELEHEALLDIVVWARRPIRQSAGKEELAQHIAEIRQADFAGLSHRGLTALARLRGLDVQPGMDRKAIEAALKKCEGIWNRIRRKRRALIGTVLVKLLHEDSGQQQGEYRFLPEESKPSLKAHIEEEGMVGGIARKLRGVADNYVHEKLDEIEARIDQKLDEIDKRMGEWRDREVSNRLKILKITLIVSILVALLSLGYDYLRSRLPGTVGPEQPVSLFQSEPGGAILVGVGQRSASWKRVFGKCTNDLPSVLRRSLKSLPQPSPANTTWTMLGPNMFCWPSNAKAPGWERVCFMSPTSPQPA